MIITYRSSIHSEGLCELYVSSEVVLRYTGLAALESGEEVFKFGLKEDCIALVLELLHISFEIFLVWVLLVVSKRSVLGNAVIEDFLPETNLVQTSHWAHQSVIDQTGDV